jgi:hypothetical protein
MIANFQKAKHFNLHDFTTECVKRGKMTELEAQKLRMSVHTFVGAFGTTPLSDLEIPRWLITHCKVCEQSECTIYKKVNE